MSKRAREVQEESQEYGYIGDNMVKSEVWWKRLAAGLRKWFKLITCLMLEINIDIS